MTSYREMATQMTQQWHQLQNQLFNSQEKAYQQWLLEEQRRIERSIHQLAWMMQQHHPSRR